MALTLKRMKDKTREAFLALVQAGLWEKDVTLSEYGNIDYKQLLQLAEEQSVVGLVAAGLEHVVDTKIPQMDLLQFIGRTLQIEEQNKAMNSFLGSLVKDMRKVGIYVILVKGQGVAQCYERPLWRASGDVDFLLSEDNYKKTKDFLLPLSFDHKSEGKYSKHLGLSVESWHVELQGSLRTSLSSRIDRVIDEVQKDVFYGGNVRSWTNNGVQIFLPGANNDVFFVFTHYLKHFYKEGMSLRQICDWCRLLWKYRDKIDDSLLEKRLHKADLITEWKAFAALAVDYLGIPIDAMPLYSDKSKWGKKANKIILFILNGYMSSRFINTLKVGRIFPIKTLEYLFGILFELNVLKINERLLKSLDWKE